MNKLISNYVFNTLYQLFIMVIPLASMPYVSRVIGPEGIGINAYSSSIAQAFVLFSVLGIPLYGNRQVASVKQQGIIKLSQNFWSIYLIQLISSILIITIYLFFVFCFVDSNKTIYYIQMFILIASMLDISWLFIGLEQLKKVVIRNTVVRLSSLVFIFIFVNDQEDLALYVIIITISNVLGQAIMWTQAFKYIRPPKITNIQLAEHIKPILLIFLPQLIIQLYVVLDRILLGLFVNETEVGFYEQALRIVKVSLSVITSIAAVMLPRIAAEFTMGNINKIRFYSDVVVRFVLFISTPMAIGLAVIAPIFTQWFFGPGYEKVGVLIIIMSPIIVLIGLSNVFGMQILVPVHKQNKLTISVSVGALISIFTNVILVSFLASIGTAISTLVAEFSVTFIMVFFVKEYLNPKSYMKVFIKYCLVSTFMGLFIYLTGFYLGKITFYVTIIQITSGIAIYFIILLIFKDKFLFGLLNKILNKERNKQYV